MKIGIVGNGVVGKAVGIGLWKMENDNQIFANDKDPSLSKYTKKELVENCDVIFICVPTPNKKNGAIDLTPLMDTILEFVDIVLRSGFSVKVPPLIIKSTILPEMTKALNLTFNPSLRFSFSPEFITEKRGWLDVVSASRTVIGSEFPDHIELLKKLYKNNANVIVTDSNTAELAKYLSNIFLVLKVAYSLHIKGLSEVFKADAKTVAMIVGMDPRIGLSHLNPELGKIPKKSPCLPKDIRALRTELSNRGVKSELLKVAEDIGVEI